MKNNHAMNFLNFLVPGSFCLHTFMNSELKKKLQHVSFVLWTWFLSLFMLLTFFHDRFRVNFPGISKSFVQSHTPEETVQKSQNPCPIDGAILAHSLFRESCRCFSPEILKKNFLESRDVPTFVRMFPAGWPSLPLRFAPWKLRSWSKPFVSTALRRRAWEEKMA